jgi:hypothetical protein
MLGCTLESILKAHIKKAGRMPSCAIGSVQVSMLRSECANILGHILSSIIKVYWGAS